jgi:hypothetical protein
MIPRTIAPTPRIWPEWANSTPVCSTPSFIAAKRGWLIALCFAAVARKLSILLLRLWVTGEVYEPLRNAKKRGELLSYPS